jgi:hypothetical protein
MKQTLLTIICITYFLTVHSQTVLFNKTWKVRELSTRYQQTKTILYHRDSATNKVNFSKLAMTFKEDGTYKGALAGDTASKAGVWALSNKLDSVMIDGVNYQLLTLDSESFVAQGYSLQLADTTGKIDTVFNTLALYAVGSALPVTLSSFTGTYLQNKVRLVWSTVTEVNSEQFQVEGSHDGRQFEAVGSVPGKGNSNMLVEYSFDDVEFFKVGKNFYRLKQIDRNGHVELSSVVVVNVSDVKRTPVRLFPNPAKNEISLDVALLPVSNLQLIITEISGRQVLSRRLQGNRNPISVALPQLASGMYVVIIINEREDKLLMEKLTIR